MLYWLSEENSKLLQTSPESFIEALGSPLTADDHFSLAAAHDHLGKGLLALRHYREALQKNLAHIPSCYALGIKFLERGKDAEAKSYLKRALRMDSLASKTALHLLRDLRAKLTNSVKANEFSVWIFQELERLKKSNSSTSFQLGKLLFERSAYEEAASYLLKSLEEGEVASEATEYLSYIYEHLYKGEELIEKTLQLAEKVRDRSDLFFNLAMVCQHDHGKLELAMHFFYLATKEDPADPGLKFSLEQAAIELMNHVQKSDPKDREFLLMLAHLYQGSLGVAKRYAQNLSHLQFPEAFMSRSPETLWRDWLLKDNGILGQALQSWFGGKAPHSKKLLSLTPR